ncbi:MAG: hypothetical protein ACM37W_20255 [Actinomycetota bacterium]
MTFSKAIETYQFNLKKLMGDAFSDRNQAAIALLNARVPCDN